MSQPRNWEEAFDQLADENHKLRNDKNALWGALDNLTSLWEFAASDRAIEASVKAAREILNRTTPPEAMSTKNRTNREIRELSKTKK